jgi:hypothetical protein
MLTTLSIVSLDQGKFAPHYDIEPKWSDELAELAASKTETPVGRFGHLALAIWQKVSARVGHRKPSAVSHA